MSDKKPQCVPCSGGTPPVSEADRLAFLSDLPCWTIENGHLVKSIPMSDFMGPMKLANKIADLAESISHHPDLHVRWGELKVEIWTHAIDNLSEADFYLAGKIDELTV